MSQDLVSFRREGRVGVVTLARPEALNAISGVMADQIAGAFAQCSEDPDIWVVILAAEGERAFCVGADLKERASFSLEQFHANRVQVRGMFEAIRSTPQPTIAAPFGFALGGGFELVLSCDLIVAADDVVLGLPEATVGLLPAGGGTQLLTKRVGPGAAKEMIFTGRRIDAVEASRLGLLVASVPRASLIDEAMRLAHAICKASPVAVRGAKRAIDAALGLATADGIAFEHEVWEGVITSDDRAEGIAAFNEKRDPDWSNR